MFLCVCSVIDQLMTSNCGKNKKVAHEVIAECFTDVLTMILITIGHWDGTGWCLSPSRENGHSGPPESGVAPLASASNPLPPLLGL